MRFHRTHLWAAALIGLGLTAAALVPSALAGAPAAPRTQTSPLHPTFALLDSDGQNVLDSGKPLSTSKTCGACHDTAYIESHSFHADLGYSTSTEPGKVPNGQPWETSTGLYGNWDPITYRYLSPDGDQRIDLTPVEWLKLNAARIVGGGPAEVAAGVEMDCFLCHFNTPSQAERAEALKAGNFAWANTATLVGAGIVSRSADGYTYNPAAFNSDGKLQAAYVTVHDPSNENCGLCHGLAHASPEPLTTAGQDLAQWQTATTGQIMSPQKISQSGMNIADKADLAYAWDLHADRGLQCVDCHYSLNNPVLVQTNAKAQPDSVLFDPRRLEIGEYLLRPNHEFARGQSAQFTVSEDLRGTMRRCETCHEATQTHAWLPYTEQHMASVACETCHIPALHAPALQSVDWTVITEASQPVLEWRGVSGGTGTLSDLITGYTPMLALQNDSEGGQKLAPYNLVTAWYWVYDDPAGTRPVRLEDLQAAYLENGLYRSEIVTALDENGDGALSSSELRLSTPDKQSVIQTRLAALGLVNPRLSGEVQPYRISHDVVRGDAAIKECSTCHSSDSRIGQAMTLSGSGPTGISPTLLNVGGLSLTGSVSIHNDITAFTPSSGPLYQFGRDSVNWIDWFGVLAVIGVLIGVTVHGGLRYYASLKTRRKHSEVKRVYMYSVYERFWHWFQTFAILILVFTGLMIHRPDMFGVAFFPQAVVVHNIVAVLLAVNAALSLFYHLVSGEIRTFIPRPYGFFDQAIVQTLYYLKGIFKHEPHPFEKTPDRKLNPLQQITYFGILNVLLPLQIATGALILGVQSFPQFETWLGGLPFLAPFHSLVAWTFAAFIIMHVYLTTTGHTPLGNIEAMMVGWDEVEVASGEAAAQPASGD